MSLSQENKVTPSMGHWVEDKSMTPGSFDSFGFISSQAQPSNHVTLCPNDPTFLDLELPQISDSESEDEDSPLNGNNDEEVSMEDDSELSEEYDRSDDGLGSLDLSDSHDEGEFRFKKVKSMDSEGDMVHKMDDSLPDSLKSPLKDSRSKENDMDLEKGSNNELRFSPEEDLGKSLERDILSKFMDESSSETSGESGNTIEEAMAKADEITVVKDNETSVKENYMSSMKKLVLNEKEDKSEENIYNGEDKCIKEDVSNKQDASFKKNTTVEDRSPVKDIKRSKKRKGMVERPDKKSTSIKNPSPIQEHEDINAMDVEAFDKVQSNKSEEYPIKRKKRLSDATKQTHIFKNMYIIVTGIKKNQSIVTEIKELALKRGASIVNHKPFTNSSHRAILISDSHQSTYKYILALAQCVPCVHYDWLFKSVKEKSLVDIKPYILPAGLDIKQNYVPLPNWFWGPLKGKKQSEERNKFDFMRLEIVGERPFKEQWTTILKAIGIRVVTRLGISTVNKITHILSDSEPKEYVIRYLEDNNLVLCSREWAIQTIIRREVIDPLEDPAYMVQPSIQ